MFPSHIKRFFSNIFVDSSMFEKGRYSPLNRRSCTLRAKFHQLNVELLLAVVSISIGATLEKIASSHHDAGQGVFAARLVGESSTVG